MTRKMITVAILGCGSRGITYGDLMLQHEDQYKIVSVCDIKPSALSKASQRYGIDPDNVFADENRFFEKKRADLLVVATLDKDHVRQCLRALELGYDILVEKPISDSREECYDLLNAQKKYGGKVFVCHVLRYAPAFVKAGELLKSGAIGRLVAIDALEQVAYWHQAHSYVRGNWRRSEETTPMLMAKCCHDLDLLQFYAGARCETITSVGDLTFFNRQNAPSGSSERCLDCKYVDQCPYSARRCYTERWKKTGSAKDAWPYNVITSEFPLTEEAIERGIKNTMYGRCVFFCDNDVVDHQLSTMSFENGVKATLTMTGFTAEIGRHIVFHGTYGEIVLNEELPYLELKKFGEEPRRIDLTDTQEVCGFAHGGGDYMMIRELYDMLTNEEEGATALESSLESHLMCIAAEESRLAKGKMMYVHGYREECSSAI